MIQTKIPGIDAGEIELNIENELQNICLEKIPEEIEESQLIEEETKYFKQLYGLSYYLKKMGDPVYRKNAIKEFSTSQKYRKTFYYLFLRALKNKITKFLKGTSS